MGRPWIINIALILIGLLKCFLITLFLAKGFSSFEFILLMNPLSAILFSYFWNLKDPHRLRVLTIFILDVSIPIFGFLGILLFLVLDPIFKKIYNDHVIDVYDLPMGENQYKNYSDDKNVLITNKNKDSEMDELYDSFKIEPYIDILDGDNLDLKISAIEKLSVTNTANSVAILKHALNSEEYEVRYFSNNALEKIEKNLLAKIEIVSEDIIKNPTDFSSYNERAGFYFDTFLIGILDPRMGRFFLEKSLYDFIFSLQLNPSQSYLYVKIVQVHLQLRDYQQVLDLANRALETDIDEDDKAKIIFYRAEANFFLRNFDQVAKDCKIVSESNISYNLVRDSSDWWSQLARS